MKLYRFLALCISLCMIMAFAGCGSTADEGGETVSTLEVSLLGNDLANNDWAYEIDGSGNVDVTVDFEDTEDSNMVYNFKAVGTEPGDLTLTFNYVQYGGGDPKYTVVYDLTVNKDKTIVIHSCEGDTDTAIVK